MTSSNLRSPGSPVLVAPNTTKKNGSPVFQSTGLPVFRRFEPVGPSRFNRFCSIHGLRLPVRTCTVNLSCRFAGSTYYAYCIDLPILVISCRLTTSESQRLQMDIHGSQWISMDIHGHLWLSMDIRGYPWISMDIHGYPWISMDIHGFP